MKHAKLILLGAVFVTLVTPTLANPPLTEGIWEGSLTNAQGKRYKINYSVQYPEENRAEVSIIMVNLDLEPTPDYTYQLTDILVNNKTLSFKIPRDHDTRICNLEKHEDESYSGDCQSDKATEDESSQIVMIPPQESEA